MAEFDLSALLKGVSRSDTGDDELRYIPYGDILPDPNNGYSMEGIEDLARSIEIVGLQQPIRVRMLDAAGGTGNPSPTGKKYMILSGHRRYAAIGLLIDRGSKQFDRGVPCVVDGGVSSPAMQELKLLLANADNRKLTSADEAQQAERISDCIRRLEDEGFTFPGRHRDWVAQLSGMSRTKLARLDAIRNKLSSTLYRDYYSKGKMNEAVAYEFSKQSPETQQKIIDCFTSNGKKVEYIYSSDVEHYVDLANKFAALKCPVKKGEKCLNQSRLLDKCFDGGYTYKPCRYGNNTCCAKCDQYLHCKFRCPLMDEKAKAERSKQREASREQKAAEKAAKDAAIVNIEHVWARFGMALYAAGLTEKQLRAQLKKKEKSYNEFDTYLSTDKVAALLDYSCTETSQNDPLPFYHGFFVDDYRRLCEIADALGCSLDYLFLRSDEPKATQPVSDPDTAPGWKTGEPPRDGRYLCMVDMGLNALSEQQLDYKGGEWYAYGSKVDKMLTVKPWYPLPDKRTVAAREEEQE